MAKTTTIDQQWLKQQNLTEPHAGECADQQKLHSFLVKMYSHCKDSLAVPYKVKHNLTIQYKK